jgi:hypothetical protein
MEDAIVESDIWLYLDFRLSVEQVEEGLPELRPPPWQPTEEQKKMLVGSQESSSSSHQLQPGLF